MLGVCSAWTVMEATFCTWQFPQLHTHTHKCVEINSLRHRDFELALQGGLAAYHSQRTALVESLLLCMPWS